MATSRAFRAAMPPTHGSVDAMTAWWLHQWLETMAPVARLQMVWLETLGDAMRHEAEFLSALAASGDRLSRCAWNQDLLRDPSTLASCYHGMAGEMTEATLKRMVKVTELSRDFRERIWDEL